MGDSNGPEKDTLETNHSHNHPVDLIPCLLTVYPHDKILQYIIKPISQIHQLRVFVPCSNSISKMSAESVTIHVFCFTTALQRI